MVVSRFSFLFTTPAYHNKIFNNMNISHTNSIESRMHLCSPAFMSRLKKNFFCRFSLLFICSPSIGQTDWISATCPLDSLSLVRLTRGKQKQIKRSYKASSSTSVPLCPFIRQVELHCWSTSMLTCSSPYEHAVKVCVFVCTSKCMYTCFQVWVRTAAFACVIICVCAWTEGSILDTENTTN